MLRAQQSFQLSENRRHIYFQRDGTKFVAHGDDDTRNKQSQLATKDLFRDSLYENSTRINWLLVASIQVLYF